MKNPESFLKYAGAIVLVGVGGFLSLFLIKSIVTLAIVSVGLICMFYGLPVFAQWAANMASKGTLANSKLNPIEDLIALYAKKDDAIKTAGQAITEFSIATKTYKDKLDDFIKRRPEKAETFMKTYSDMNRVLDIQKRKLGDSQTELKKFQLIIEEANDIMAMTEEANRANKYLKKFEQPNIMDQLRQRTALDEVMNSLNRVTSDLELAVSLDYNNIPKDFLLTSEQNPVTIQAVSIKEITHV